MENDWRKSLYRKKILGKSRYRFLEKNVIKSSKHIYKSGLRGTFFSDFDQKSLSPNKIEEMLFLYIEDISNIKNNHPIDFLAFIDKERRGTVGAIRFSIALSSKLNIPHIIVRPWREISIDRIKIPSDLEIKDKNISIVTDHITTGEEVKLAIEDIKKVGGIVTDIITHTIMEKFFEDNRNEAFPIIHYHHKLPDDLPYEKKNELYSKSEIQDSS